MRGRTLANRLRSWYVTRLDQFRCLRFSKNRCILRRRYSLRLILWSSGMKGQWPNSTLESHSSASNLKSGWKSKRIGEVIWRWDIFHFKFKWKKARVVKGKFLRNLRFLKLSSNGPFHPESTLLCFHRFYSYLSKCTNFRFVWWRDVERFSISDDLGWLIWGWPHFWIPNMTLFLDRVYFALRNLPSYHPNLYSWVWEGFLVWIPDSMDIPENNKGWSPFPTPFLLQWI